MNLLLIAYKIEKGKGSEDGIGYHLARTLQRHASNMTLVTRVNNAEKLRFDPDFAGVNIIGLDVPRVFGFFKRGSRGIILYYYLWQICVGLRVRRLCRDYNIDVVHQVTFATTWAAHFLHGPRIVWGPLINHQAVPRDFWSGGICDFVRHEIPTRLAKMFFWTCDPFLRMAIKRTDRILLAYDNRPGPFAHVRHKTAIIPCAGTHFPVIEKKPRTEKFTILFIGRFVDLKGCMTALEVLRRAFERGLNRNNVIVRFIGHGPRECAMRQFAAQHQIPLEIVPWVDQDALVRHYTEASVFLYPSFEGQGLVVTEALAHGCPVVCLEGTGPHALAGDGALAAPVAGFDTTCDALALRVRTVYDQFMNDPTAFAALTSTACVRARALEWAALANKIAEHYKT